MNNDSIKFLDEVSKTLFKAKVSNRGEHKHNSLFSSRGEAMTSLQQKIMPDSQTFYGEVSDSKELNNKISKDKIVVRSFSNSIRYKRSNKNETPKTQFLIKSK